MNKLTKSQWDEKEAEMERYQKRIAEIDEELAIGPDSDEGEEEYLIQLKKEERELMENLIWGVQKELRNSFVSERWEDDPGFDYQLTEMKA